MSKVISFRLDETNPREIQALKVLNTWIEMGYSSRFIITNALLELGASKRENESNQDEQGFEALSKQIHQVYEIVKTLTTDYLLNDDHQAKRAVLSENLISSLKRNIKPGIKSE